MREADDEALHRASVYVDTPAALAEGGDVAVAIATGAYEASRIRGDMSALLAGRVPGRTSSGEITLFKSVGASLEDLAAAALVWRNLDTDHSSTTGRFRG
jgi:ornithine cyclodeaminase